MTRYRFGAVVIVAAGVAIVAFFALRELGGSNEPDWIRDRARPLAQRLAAIGHVRIRFTSRPPHVSPAERRAQRARELNEGSEPRQRVALGAPQAQRSDVATSTPSAAGDLVVFTNTMAYRRVGDSSDVWVTSEPSLAMNGDRALLTWNFGAAASSDGGTTFSTYLDPRAIRRSADSPEPLPFCCDQLAYHVPSRDSRPELWFWVVQTKKDEPDEVIRLQWLAGDAPFKANTFRWLDLSAQSMFKLPARYWLDQPRIASTDDHLFLAVNAYTAPPEEEYYATYVVRLSLDSLSRGEPGDSRIVQVGSEKIPALVGFTRGATDTMYFAAHRTSSHLRVWKWPDDSPDPDGHVTVEHHAFGDGEYDCRRAGSSTPWNWCGDNDARVLSGWLAKGVIGFAWNAPANAEAGFAHPYVQVVQLNEDDLKLRDEPSIVLDGTSVSYAALVPNGRGDVGGVVLVGGGGRREGCLAVSRDPRADITAGWSSTPIDTSTSDSTLEELGERMGDYLGATTTVPDGNVWAGACMTIHGGDMPRVDDVEVRFATFGRAEDRLS